VLGICTPWAGGCSNSRSTLVVQSVKRSDRGALKRFALRLEQFCDGDDEPLRLFARFKRGDTTMPPPPGDPEDMAWHAPSGAVPSSGDYLYLESRPGGWVGQGETYLLPIDESTRVDPVRREVDVRFAGSPGNWNLLTGVPTGGRNGRAVSIPPATALWPTRSRRA
jgi:hypothetical protein